MIKLFLLIFLFSFTHAGEISSDALDGIFVEAVLFIMLFTIMGIVSFFISRKHAQKYEQKNPLHERRTARKKRELIERFLTINSARNKDAVLLWLSKLVEKNMIDAEEFKILEESLNASSNSK